MKLLPSSKKKQLRVPAFAAGLIVFTALLSAQTKIDLRMQTRNVDFSNSSMTRPVRTGTGLPPTCVVGELYYRIDTTAGKNLYLCTGVNVWTVLSGDLIPGTMENQILRWNSNQWRASTESVSSVMGRTGVVSAQSGDYSFPQISGTAGVGQGGTGLTSIGAGSLLYAPSANTLGALSLGNTLQIAGGNLSVNPANLDLGATATGILPVSRGGTGTGTILPASIQIGATAGLQSSGCLIDSGNNLSCPGTLQGGGNSGQPGEAQLYDGSGVNYYSWMAPPAISSTVRFQWPGTGPSAGQMMVFGTPTSNISNVSFVNPITTTSADTLQNKTLDTSTTFSGLTVWNQIATPSAAPAGSLRVYAKTGSGICWENSAGVETCAGSGGSPVSTVFGRVGAVAAQSGDYSAAQVTHAADVTAANTYTNGARQSVGPSATTAGLSIGCAALPSTPVTGDVACDSADSNKLKQWNGSSWLTLGFSGSGLTDPGSNGIVARTGSGSTAARTIIAGSSNITVVNGSGTGGNPTVDVGANVELLNTSQNISGDRTMSGKVDSSGATATLPFQTGIKASIPATCTTGQVYFSSDEAPGRRIQACSATNTWSSVAYDQGTAASRPGSCATGQIYFATDAPAGQNLYFCTATNTWTQMTGAGGGSVVAGDNISTARGSVDYTVLDSSVIQLVDDFVGMTGSTGGWGQLGWSGTGAGTTNAYVDSVANHPGILKLNTATTSGSLAAIFLSAGNAAVFPDITSFTNWEARWVVKLGATTNLTAFVGFAYPSYVAGDPPNYWLGVRFDPGAGDTDWTVQTRINGATGHSEADTGQLATSTDWFTIRLRSTVVGTIGFSVAKNGGAFSTEKTACASGCDITTNIPAQIMSPFMNVITRTTSAASMQVDWFAFKARGLSR
jgi:hypothetical protein